MSQETHLGMGFGAFAAVLGFMAFAIVEARILIWSSMSAIGTTLTSAWHKIKDVSIKIRDYAIQVVNKSQP
eukprot:UN18063